MRLIKIIVIAVVALIALPMLAPAGPGERTLAEVEACSRTEDVIKEYPAACYVAVVLQEIAGKPVNEAVKIIDEAIKNAPAAAQLAKPALENIKVNLVFDDFVKSPKEAEDFLASCSAGNTAACGAAAARLLDYSGVKLLTPPANEQTLGEILGSKKLDFSEVPSGANADIQLVAGAALADILNLPFGYPEGCIKYGKIPGNPGDETGLIVDGKTPYARAACSDIAVGQTINDWIPPRGIDAPKIRAIYARMTEAETKSKMELAYMLARVYVFLLKDRLVGRGLAEAIRLSDECLSGKDLVIDGFAFECSKYKSLRLAGATDFQVGFFRFFGHLAGVSCEDLLKRAETGATKEIRLSAARAYVSGQVVPPGVEQKCIAPYNKASLLKLVREGKSAELRAEAAGDIWLAFNDGKAIGVYFSPRGLAEFLICGSLNVTQYCLGPDADEKLLDDPGVEVRLAAWNIVGRAWAQSKSRAFAWGEAINGKNEARRRAGAFAYFFPRGLDNFRTYMEPMAQGNAAEVEKYTLDGTKAQVRRGVAMALALLDKRSVDELIKATSGDGERATVAGLALARALINQYPETAIRNLISQYPFGVPRTDGFPVKEPLTAALVEAFGTRIKESIK